MLRQEDNSHVPLLSENSRRERTNGCILTTIFAFIFILGIFVGLYFIDKYFFEDRSNVHDAENGLNLLSQVYRDVNNLTVGGYEICDWEVEQFTEIPTTLDGKPFDINWEDQFLVLGMLCEDGLENVIVFLNIPKGKPPSGTFDLDDGRYTLDETGTKWVKEPREENDSDSIPFDWNDAYESYESYIESIESRYNQAPGVDGDSVGLARPNRRSLKKHIIPEKVNIRLVLEIKEGRNEFESPELAAHYATAMIYLLHKQIFQDIDIDLQVSSIVLLSSEFISLDQSAGAYLEHLYDDYVMPLGSQILLAMTTRHLGSFGEPGGVFTGRSVAVAGGLYGRGFIGRDKTAVVEALLQLFGKSLDDDLSMDTLLQIRSDFTFLKKEFEVISSGYSMALDQCDGPVVESINNTDLVRCKNKCEDNLFCTSFSFKWLNITGTCNIREDTSCAHMETGFSSDSEVDFTRNAYGRSRPKGYLPFAGQCPDASENSEDSWEEHKGIEREACAKLCDKTKACRGFHMMRVDRDKHARTCILEFESYEQCKTRIGVCDPALGPCFYGSKDMYNVPQHYARLEEDCDAQVLQTSSKTLQHCAEDCDSNKECLGFSFKEQPTLSCKLKADTCDRPLGRGTCSPKESCFFEKLDI